MKILLIGNPNVGKSSLFSRLTGVEVVCSNYPGTTVNYSTGTVRCAGEKAGIIDVPGTYSLKAENPAEKVATDMLKDGDVIVNVVDATNLERNLNLTLQVLEYGKPAIIALNMSDDARHLGIEIDKQALEEALGVPVVETVALTGQGLKELIEKIPYARSAPPAKRTDADRWKEIGRILERTQKRQDKQHSLAELLEDATIKPLTGIPIALLVLYLLFSAIIGAGDALTEYAIDPFFHTIYLPAAKAAVEPLIPRGLAHNLLLGTSDDPVAGLGMLTTGLYIPIGMILPFVILFYLALGLLEDIGYLPRIATLMDNVMHRIGLHGSAIIPAILGMGCKVPGILATRILETEKQRFISATLIAISIPCLAQNAVIVSLLMRYGIQYVAIVYATLIIIHIAVGLLLNKMTKGESPEILLEIPPYRKPSFGTTIKKTWIRVKYFLKEAVPYIIIGVFIANILFITGTTQKIAETAGPTLTAAFGIPGDAVLAILVGFIRKDAAVGMLAAIPMTPMQLTIACILLVTYFPCIATLVVLYNELGIKNFLKTIALMIVVTFVTGVVLKMLLL
ncbi:MAG: ferrous iron transporter B [Candidatus Altiarchaeia archaeon]